MNAPTHAEGERPVPIRALLLASILPTLALAQEAPPAPRPVEWKGTVGAGLILTGGNSESTTVNGAAAASRETFGWISSLKADATYGKSRPAAGGAQVVSAYKGGGLLRLDRKFGDTWTVYAMAGVTFDHVASIEYRSAYELGVSAQWVEEKVGDWTRLMLRTDLGFQYGHESRWDYYGPTPGALPGVEVVAPRLGLAFRYGFSKDSFFTEDAEYLPTLTSGGRWLAKTVSKISSRLVGAVAVGASYTLTYDSDPVAGKKGTDTTLAAMVDVGF
jgi:hypothetical protein